MAQVTFRHDPGGDAAEEKAPADFPVTQGTAQEGTAGQTLWWAFRFRITDEAGLPVEGVKPAVTVTEETGSNIHAAHVKLGEGWNTFEISYGELTKTVQIGGK